MLVPASLCVSTGRARVRVRERASFRYTLECSQSRLFWIHTRFPKTEKPLIFFSSLPGREPPLSPPLPLPLSLSWDERTRGNVGPAPHSDQI